MSDATPKYSVVIPVYNSQETLKPLYRRLADVFAQMGEDFEVIFVNDGSRDGSAAVLKELADSSGNVIFADLLRNFGQQNAILCGMSLAAGERVITMDDDLQNPPEEIPKLIRRMEEGDFEVVYGSPLNKRHGSYRNLGSWVIQVVLEKLFGAVRGGVSSFRILSKKVKDCLLRYQGSFAFIDGLIYQNTSYIGYEPVTHNERRHGRSNYGFSALFLLATNLFFNFTITPLRFMFVAGLLLSTGAGVVAAFILYYKLVGTITFPGYTSIMVYFSLLFGALFMFLGLIGEYVGRIAQGVSRTPQYAIRKVISKGREIKMP